jgi:ribonucleotide reductase alpha subunit
VSLIYILFIFFTTFFIMNLFISVIVDKFNEEIKKRQGSDNFTDEQKEWVKIQRLLVHTSPKIIPVEPINCFRLQCFKIVQSQAFEYVVMTAIVINTFFLCIDYYGKSDDLARVLQNSNYSFVVFFTAELILKITSYGFKYYWYVNWNKFDFIIVIMSLVALDERMLEEKLNFNVTALRIIRVSRLLRMVKTSEGLRTLLKTLFMSLGNIINTALLLFLILFTFAVAGMSLFSMVPEGDYINENTNFKSFYLSFMSLWQASTGDSWNGIMHDCYND